MEDYKKKYNSAMEVMRQWIAPCHTQEQLDVMKTSVFPELKESEDERIKKELIMMVKLSCTNGDDVNKKIAWLEKQGEHANFCNKIQIGDKVTRNENGVLVNLSQLKRVAKKNENQCEHKSIWSEEDKKTINEAIEYLEKHAEYVREGFSKQYFLDLVSRVESLKDRYTWKPNEYDILLLERIANGKSNPQDFQASLGGLIGKLKKLME